MKICRLKSQHICLCNYCFKHQNPVTDMPLYFTYKLSQNDLSSNVSNKEMGLIHTQVKLHNYDSFLYSIVSPQVYTKYFAFFNFLSSAYSNIFSIKVFKINVSLFCAPVCISHECLEETLLLGLSTESFPLKGKIIPHLMILPCSIYKAARSNLFLLECIISTRQYSRFGVSQSCVIL